MGYGGSIKNVRTGPKPRTGCTWTSDLAFFPISVVAVMATFQTKRDPLLRNVSPTPSKIPVRSKRCPPLPTVKACALDQENQDPKVRALVDEDSSYRKQHTQAVHPNAELSVFLSPRDWSRSSVFSVPTLIQQAPDGKPHIKQRNQRDWWGALSSGTPWRSSGLALGDKM